MHRIIETKDYCFWTFWHYDNEIKLAERCEYEWRALGSILEIFAEKCLSFVDKPLI